MQAPPEDRLQGPWRQRIAILMGAHLVGTVNVVSVLAMAPVIQTTLGLSATEVGLLVTAYYTGQAVWSLPAGGLVDRIGVGRILVGAMGGIAVGTTVVALAHGLPVALFGMFMMGSGYSFTNPSTAKGVYQWFPQRRRATAMGAKQTGVPLGGVIAAGLGALAATVDWRLLLGVAVGSTLCFGAVCLLLVEPKPAPAHERPSMLGGLRDLLRDGNFGRFALCNLLYNFGQANFFAFLTLFVREAARSSQEFAGLCLGVAQATSAAARFGWGVVSDTLFRGERKRLVVGLGALAALLLALMPLAASGWPAAAILLIVAGLGITVASYAGLMQTLAVEAVEPRLTGSAVGYNSVATHFGAIVGPPAFGAIVDATGGFTGGWIVTALVVAAGVLLFLRGFREGARL